MDQTIGAGGTSGCSMVDGNLAHSMDQDGSRMIITYIVILPIFVYPFLILGQSLPLIA
jgi:hypothetical protein